MVPGDLRRHRRQLLRQQVLDVPIRQLTPARVFVGALLALTLAGILLRLQGIHAPIFDHPGWRQGDTAAIARNFARLQYNILYPQTDYDGPPPNYVELELQIVPFLAATLYKVFGVHETFGRLISLAFGAATIPLVGYFGRWLFRSDLAGGAAAALYAVLPGAWYYSRTFMPDTAMTFFATAALFAAARWIVDGEARSWRRLAVPGMLLATAFLAKPVAVVAAVPIAAVAVARLGLRGAIMNPRLWTLMAAGFVPLALYDRAVSSRAEWHWASGITRLHVLPSLAQALTSAGAFAAKAAAFAHALWMLPATMLGAFGAVLAVAGC
ncbi:MAG: glycosyltransferase family 39 protein, partial [Candidatus Eremiobacteraeota bacterium]|nr:glycosyltransferase family 39 protein [Candidatus Eremiobacteraeota bacterium]